MNSGVSISKGCFVYKNKNINLKSEKSKRTKTKNAIYQSFLSEESLNEFYYKSFSQMWNKIEGEILQLRSASFIKVNEKLVEFFEDSYIDMLKKDTKLPTATLLMGVNQPDHEIQFETLSKDIKEISDSYKTVTLHSHDGSSLKSLVEIMVKKFITTFNDDVADAYETELNENDNVGEYHEFVVKDLKKSNCTMNFLQEWYQKKLSHKIVQLIVILPNIESFPNSILESFILLLCSFSERLPFSLILGVATSVSNLCINFPTEITRKLKMKIFQLESACDMLNKIIDNILLAPKYPFHLSGSLYKFLTEIFSLYDFSITGFIQGFKYCMINHFFHGNEFALCSEYENSLNIVSKLSSTQIESIRRLPSFRPYVESLSKGDDIISILTDDNYFTTNHLPKMLKYCHVHFVHFRCFIEFLWFLISDLPRQQLGKHKWEIYSICSSTNILENIGFTESWKMLSILSQDDFKVKLRNAIEKTKKYSRRNLLSNQLLKKCGKNILKVLDKLNLKITEKFEMNNSNTVAEVGNSNKEFSLTSSSRKELQEKLLQLSKKREYSITEARKSIIEILDYIKVEIVKIYLTPFKMQSAPVLYELFVFDNISSVQEQILGSPRAAIHTALTDPRSYLACDCCMIESVDNIQSSMPDLSIVYKLYLECGRMINLYDWLQAFKSIVDCSTNEMTENDDDDDEECENNVNPEIQARFARAVAELQFLGYIKTSKRKTDHVMKLTW